MCNLKTVQNQKYIIKKTKSEIFNCIHIEWSNHYVQFDFFITSQRLKFLKKFYFGVFYSLLKNLPIDHFQNDIPTYYTLNKIKLLIL